MFRRKNDKRIVELNPKELRLAKYALLGFRNKLVVQGIFSCLLFLTATNLVTRL